MKEDILMTLFGGGIADYDMLEKCNYDFEDILKYIEDFTDRNEMVFNDILLGAINLYQSNIQAKIDKRIEEIEDNIKYLDNKISCCSYDKYDEIELNDNQNDLEKLQKLDAFEDIEYFTNYLDTHIFINDEEIRAIYKELLADEVDAENDEIGFVWLDLD